MAPTVEEKARAYRKSRYWLTNQESDCGPEEIEPAYLAGHAEGVKDARRWHTFDEAPPLNVQVLVLNEAYNSVKLQTFRHADTLYKPGYRMFWQEIGPLPSEAQSEAPEAK